MINLDWANEQHPQDYTKEQIEQSRQQQSQAAAANYQQTTAQIPALRARAAELIAALVTGPGVGELQQALGWLDAAADPPYVAGAVQALRTAIERWSQSALIAVDMRRLNAPALAAQQAHQRQAERNRPKAPPTAEELAGEVARLTGEVAEQRRRLDRCEEIFKGYLGVE